MTEEIKALEEEIIKRIKTVYDPEIPVNIYDLGLIYDIRVDEQKNVNILMTLTSPNCPSAEELPREVEQKTKEIEGVGEVVLQLTFDPPWDKDMMSEEAQFELGFL